MSITPQEKCLSCPLKQTCFQWRTFDKEKCKVYQVRNVARENVWVKE